MCYYTAIPVNNNVSQKEDVTRTLATTSCIQLPPPPSCWGENRAKFSDVVARNQETVSTFSNLNNVHKNQTNTLNLSTVFNTDFKDIQYAKPQQSPDELVQTPKEYSPISKPVTLTSSLDKEKADPDRLILQPNSQHSNSYFLNTFAENPVSHD